MLDKSSGYTVEGNDFSSYNGVYVSSNNIGFDKQTGIVVSESGPAANELYGNRFHDLLVGIRAQGVNGLYGPILSYGLEYKCNEFEDEIFTACMATASGGIIDYTQGSLVGSNNPIEPAGNLLISTTSYTSAIPDQLWMFPNTLTQPFYYIHHNDADYTPQVGRYVNLTNSNISLVNSYQTIFDNPCNNDSFPNISSGSGSSAFNRMNILNWKIDSISQILLAGDHDSLLTILASDSLPWIYTVLSSYSPYLSSRVINRLITNAKLNPATEYYDVLIANSPLPYKMYDLCEGIDFDSLELVTLDSLQEGISPLFELQNEGSNFAIERDRILYKQIDLWLEDEEDTIRYEKVNNLLRLTPTLQAKFELIDYLVMRREFTEADYLLDSIGTADSDWSSFTDIYKDILPILSTPGSWHNVPIDSILVARIENHIRARLPGSVSLLPLLDFCLNRFSCEEIQTLSVGEAKKEGNSTEELSNSLSNIDKVGLLVFPNPNDGLFTVIFTTSEKIEGKLTLHNLIGTTIFSDVYLPKTGIRNCTTNNLEFFRYERC